jgi:hypothetical protein
MMKADSTSLSDPTYLHSLLQKVGMMTMMIMMTTMRRI